MAQASLSGRACYSSAPISRRTRRAAPSTRHAARQRTSKTARALARSASTIPAARRPRVLVAGGGIGGLVTTLALCHQGLDVACFERVREYKPWGGPIQLAANASAAMELIDPQLAKDVIESGTVTGDRLNGLLDGQSGDWFVRFDTRKPALATGLPLTIVMGRSELIQRFSKRVEEVGGKDVLRQGVSASRYEILGDGRVRLHLSDGGFEDGDVLVGADGIRSRVRSQMRGAPPLTESLDEPPGAGLSDAPQFAKYTCYAAISSMRPADVEQVGYQVFLGPGKYFVSSDVGQDRQQWYAFVEQDPGMKDEGVDRREVLLKHFEGWCPAVTDRLSAAVPADIERRDIYDRPPTLKWCQGPVALMGDAAHAMQPNMGQGGCQAIEDAAVLAQELGLVGGTSDGGGAVVTVEGALSRYQLRRIPRAAAVTGFAASASIMNTTYRRYLGSDPYPFYKLIPGAMDFWADIEKKEIIHPGRVVGQIAMLSSIDPILRYITTMGDSRQSAKSLFESQKGSMRKLPDDIFKMKGKWGFAK